jgi:hypothetical protein
MRKHNQQMPMTELSDEGLEEILFSQRHFYVLF